MAAMLPSFSESCAKSSAAHSSFFWKGEAQTNQTLASSVGNLPTTSKRRLISTFDRTLGLAEFRLVHLWGESCRQAVLFGAGDERGDLGCLRPDLFADIAP